MDNAMDETLAAPAAPEVSPLPDRRRGPRRTISEEITVERRQGDRRRRKPGVAALLGAVLSESLDAAWVGFGAPERV
jgi:hypothetical protein